MCVRIQVSHPATIATCTGRHYGSGVAGMRRMSGWAWALILLLTLSGCGTARESSPQRGVEDAGRRAVTYEASVIAIQVARPGPGLELTIQVPAGGAGCASRPRSRFDTAEHGTVFLQTLVDSNQATYCTESESRTVRSRVDLRDRDLVVNHEAWKLGPRDAFVRCSEELGCHPPDDRCDPAWTSLITDGADLPPEKRVDVLVCSARWLVVDVDAVVTGCQSVDGSTPPPGCAGEGVHRRWFATLAKNGLWKVAASGSAAGCGEVQRQVPNFPERLCRDLPAP